MRFAAFPSSSPIAVGLAVIASATIIAHTNGMVSRMMTRSGAPEIAEAMNSRSP